MYTRARFLYFHIFPEKPEFLKQILILFLIFLKEYKEVEEV